MPNRDIALQTVELARQTLEDIKLDDIADKATQFRLQTLVEALQAIVSGSGFL